MAPRASLLFALATLLAGCANPMGPPIWADWDQSQPTGAAQTRAAASAQPMAPAQPMTYDRWTPVETNGAAPLAPIETTQLAPPPGQTQAPYDAPLTPPPAAQPPPQSGAAPLAPLPGPAPLQEAPQAYYTQRTTPLTVTGLGAEAGAGQVTQTLTQRTLPLVLAGKGIDAGAGFGR